MKNKAEKNIGIRAGKFNHKAESHWFSIPAKDPLMFVNSDEFKKLQNRSRKRR